MQESFHVIPFQPPKCCSISWEIQQKTPILNLKKKLAIIICNCMWVLTCWTQQNIGPTSDHPKSLPLTMKAGIFGNFSPKRPMRNGSWKVKYKVPKGCLFDTLSLEFCFGWGLYIWRYFVEVILLIPEVFCSVFFVCSLLRFIFRYN